MKKVVEIDYEKYRAFLDLGILAIREWKERRAAYSHSDYDKELERVLSGGWWSVEAERGLKESSPQTMWNYFTLVDSDEDE